MARSHTLSLLLTHHQLADPLAERGAPPDLSSDARFFRIFSPPRFRGSADTARDVRSPRIYRAAELYDIAFDFRNVAAECSFLLAQCAAHFKSPRSFLEIAAGPAQHAIEMARRGLRAAALDREPAMVRYAQHKAARAGVDLAYHAADMTRFTLPARVDLAATLMDSASYMLDDDSVLSHLGAVADALEPGGLYVLEMSHPRDAFGAARSTAQTWSATRGSTHVTMTWGDPTDRFDPVTHITETTTTLEWRDGAESGVLHGRAPQRAFTLDEIRALVRASNRFEILEVFGSLNPAIPFSDRKDAWRMIPVLRRLER